MLSPPGGLFSSSLSVSTHGSVLLAARPTPGAPEVQILQHQAGADLSGAFMSRSGFLVNCSVYLVFINSLCCLAHPGAFSFDCRVIQGSDTISLWFIAF